MRGLALLNTPDMLFIAYMFYLKLTFLARSKRTWTIKLTEHHFCLHALRSSQMFILANVVTEIALKACGGNMSRWTAVVN